MIKRHIGWMGGVLLAALVLGTGSAAAASKGLTAAADRAIEEATTLANAAAERGVPWRGTFKMIRKARNAYYKGDYNAETNPGTDHGSRQN